MDIESQRIPEKKDSLRFVPVISLCVSSVSFLFALFVLYPWHIQLSSEFADMQRVCTHSSS
jgi:hypothetical protein